ncbi:YebG family protein [Marinomonas primoryensis]|jgi:dsDNA-binding SOS-regulon protein|uniref:YebG superfamily protein n=1 Tax=Marinomonas primoryensis TaxID=178399 RepID=A0A859CSW4_9GAMM|nr:YebG family protein [Marinomonas primoryensis]QKK79294.1 YebG superfamily protein [Marinomonas primoryensis]|tara:strand:+ start:23868 stop:24293 length:426 start_codon:yes stop_codon:yes gene_type:complete
MPVIIKYVVERDGIEKMTFTSKTEADAYDKLLDTAEALYEILDQSNLAGDHSQKEALSMYLAENKESLLDVLGTKKKAPQKSKKTNSKATNAQLDLTESPSKKALEDLVIEPDEEAVYDEDENTVVFDDEEVSDFVESDAA